MSSLLPFLSLLMQVKTNSLERIDVEALYALRKQHMFGNTFIVFKFHKHKVLRVPFY